jgi:hypothetical protein
MQCSMCNQCSCLYTCIMDYLHVLCIILMVLSCVLCITLMVFIYMYYGLFACTNLVDVMPLFSTVFSFHLPIFGKIRPEIATTNFRKITALSVKSADNLPKSAKFWYSRFLLFLRCLQCISAKFF